ncbi:MAG: hypothetical protein ACOYBP_09190 [Microbacteriaceae bacterium]
MHAKKYGGVRVGCNGNCGWYYGIAICDGDGRSVGGCSGWPGVAKHGAGSAWSERNGDLSAGVMMRGFSSEFSAAFARVYVGPVMAQAALVDGAAWALAGSAVNIGGALLIGPAGKLYAFASPESAARWVESARVIGRRERDLMETIDPATAAAWKAKKRAKLAVIAGRVVNAAARMIDGGRRAALLAEADFCLEKWA